MSVFGLDVVSNDTDITRSMSLVALYCLIVAHPGPIFRDAPHAQAMGEQTMEPKYGIDSTSA